MPTNSTPVPTGLTLESGPVTPDFQRSLENALNEMLPRGRQGAVLVVATQEGLVGGAAARLKGEWKLAGDIEVKWGGQVTGRVMVMGSW